MRQIGVLQAVAANDPEGPIRMAGFLQVLQQLGWTEGRNLRIDIRWASGDADLYRKCAADCIANTRWSWSRLRRTSSCYGESDRGGVASGHPNRANCIRARCRSGRRRLGDGLRRKSRPIVDALEPWLSGNLA
jgi:hypothetical protein